MPDSSLVLLRGAKPPQPSQIDWGGFGRPEPPMFGQGDFAASDLPVTEKKPRRQGGTEFAAEFAAECGAEIGSKIGAKFGADFGVEFGAEFGVEIDAEFGAEFGSEIVAKIDVVLTYHLQTRINGNHAPYLNFNNNITHTPSGASAQVTQSNPSLH